MPLIFISGKSVKSDPNNIWPLGGAGKQSTALDHFSGSELGLPFSCSVRLDKKFDLNKKLNRFLFNRTEYENQTNSLSGLTSYL